MAAPTTFQNGTGTTTKERRGRLAYAGAFLPLGQVSGAYYKVGGVFCITKSITGAALAPINEDEVMWIGKTKAMSTEGTQWDGLTADVSGNATGILRVLGQTPTTSKAVALEYQYDQTPMFLVIHAYNESNVLYSSELYPFSIARISNTAGLEPDSITDFEIEFYNTDSTNYPIRKLIPAHMWVAEGWYDNGGTITNADAPDGTLTAFVLGTGNGSYVGTPATPTAVVIDSTATGAAQYLYVFVNGVDVTSQVSFNAGTKTITFTTAPANGAKLNVIYGVAQNASAPGWDGGVSPTNACQFHYGWDDFGLLGV